MRLKTTALIVCAFCYVLTLSAEDMPKLEVVTDDRPVAPTAAIPLVSYADVIAGAAPSVVSVYTTRIQSYQQPEMPRGMDQLFRNFARPEQPREPQSREVTGLGSGVIISADGYIITNHHVIRDDRSGPVDEIRVQLDGGDEFIAEVVGTDARTDIAVVKIDTEQPLDVTTIANSDLLRTGDIVFAIGSPLGQSQTVTQGIVSATERTSLEILGPGSYENFIQTDAAINLGNSGGALIDAWGRLVGINTAIVSGTGGSIGLGYAIPTNMALRVARSLIEIGEVPRGLLGLYPVDLDTDLAEAFELESTRGALVNQVQEGAPAEAAGIQHGDIILKVDDVAIESAAQLRLTVSQMAPGSEVAVTLVRNGESLIKTVVLGSLSGKPVAV
ncbi:MAG: trypsin-like peptidase domain-containing protein, partial [Coraliomargarita sp.]